jgi:hypothetical protein
VAYVVVVLQWRAKLIADTASLKHDDDVVPASDTVARVYGINGNGLVREKDVNLVGENYFGVSDVLSR